MVGPPVSINQPVPPQPVLPPPFRGATQRKSEITRRLTELMAQQQQLLGVRGEEGVEFIPTGPTSEESERAKALGRVGELDQLNLLARLQLAARVGGNPLPPTGILAVDVLTAAVGRTLGITPIRDPEFLLQQAQKEFALRSSLTEIVTEVDQLTWRLQTLEMMPAAIEGRFTTGEFGPSGIPLLPPVNDIEDFIRIYMEPGTVVGREDIQWAARLINQIQQEKRLQEHQPLTPEQRTKLIIQVQTNRSASAYGQLWTSSTMLEQLVELSRPRLPDIAEDTTDLLSMLSDMGFQDAALGREMLAFTDNLTAQRDQMINERTRYAIIKSAIGDMELEDLERMIIDRTFEQITSRPLMALMLPVEWWRSRVVQPIGGLVTAFGMSRGIDAQGLILDPRNAEQRAFIHAFNEGQDVHGFNDWRAFGYAMENNETTAGWHKFATEVLVDPLSYFGFGFYDDVIRAVPRVGPRLAGLEAGYIKAVDVGFLAAKRSIYAISAKTINQIAGAESIQALSIVRRAVSAGELAQGRVVGAFSRIPIDRAKTTLRAAIATARRNPSDQGDLIDAGRILLRRAPLEVADVNNLARSLGKDVFTSADLNEGLKLLDVETAINQMISAEGRTLTTQEAVSQIAKAIGADDVLITGVEGGHQFNIIEQWVRGIADDTLERAVSLVDNADTTSRLFSSIGILVRENLIAQRSSPAALANKNLASLAAYHTLNTIPQKLVWGNKLARFHIGFARLHLLFAAYSAFNVMENAGKTALAKMNPFFRGNAADELLAGTEGLLLPAQFEQFFNARGFTLELGPVGASSRLTPARLQGMSNNTFRRLKARRRSAWKIFHEGLDDLLVKSGGRIGIQQNANYLNRAMMRHLIENEGDVIQGIGIWMAGWEDRLITAGMPREEAQLLIREAERRAMLGPSTLTDLGTNYTPTQFTATKQTDLILQYDELGTSVINTLVQAADDGTLVANLERILLNDAADMVRQDVLRSPDLARLRLRKFMDDMRDNPPRDREDLKLRLQQIQLIQSDVTNIISTQTKATTLYAQNIRNLDMKNEVFNEMWDEILLPFIDDSQREMARYMEDLVRQVDEFRSPNIQNITADVSINTAPGLSTAQINAMSNADMADLIISRINAVKPGPLPNTRDWGKHLTFDTTEGYEAFWNVQLAGDDRLIIRKIGEYLNSPSGRLNFPGMTESQVANAVRQGRTSGLLTDSRTKPFFDADPEIQLAVKRANATAEMEAQRQIWFTDVDPQALDEMYRLSLLPEMAENQAKLHELLRTQYGDRIQVFRSTEISQLNIFQPLNVATSPNTIVDEFGAGMPRPSGQFGTTDRAVEVGTVRPEDVILIGSQREAELILRPGALRRVGAVTDNQAAEFTSLIKSNQARSASMHQAWADYGKFTRAEFAERDRIIARIRSSGDLAEGTSLSDHPDLRNFWNQFRDKGRAFWDERTLHFNILDGEILEQGMRAEVRQFGTIGNKINDELTALDIAQLYNSVPQDLTAAVYNAEMGALQDRGMWVARNRARAGAIAGREGKVADDFGFTEEKIGQVYDEILKSMNLNPLTAEAAAPRLAQLKALYDEMVVQSQSRGTINTVERQELITELGNTLRSDLANDPITERLFTPEWQTARQSALDDAVDKFSLDFPDYTSATAVNATGRMIFPFWTYETHRLAWIPRTFLQRPGTLTGLSKYQDYTDNGYLHIPGTSFEINPLRGTIWMGGMRRLVNRDFPEFYDRFPGLSNTFDQLSRLGFFPNIGVSAAFTLFGSKGQGSFSQIGELVPNIVASPLEAYIALRPESSSARFLAETLLPGRFRDYIVEQFVGARGGEGVEIRDLIANNVPLTSDQQRQWDIGQGDTAKFNLLNFQLGLLRVRPEERIAFERNAREVLAECTGIPPADQERAARRGLRLAEWIPIPANCRDIVRDIEGYTQWRGLASHLQESEKGQVISKMRLFWTQIGDFADIQQAHKLDLDTEVLNGVINQRQWDAERVNIARATRQFIDDKHKDPAFQMEFNGEIISIPMTILERMAFSERIGNDPILMGGEDELIAAWHQVELRQRQDPESGVIGNDWDLYFLEKRLIEDAIRQGGGVDALSRLHSSETPLNHNRRLDYENFIRPYKASYGILLRERSEEEQIIINRERFTSDLDEKKRLIDAEDADGEKIVANFRKELGDFRTNLRRLDPELDARLALWEGLTPLSEPALQRWRELRIQYGYVTEGELEQE